MKNFIIIIIAFIGLNAHAQLLPVTSTTSLTNPDIDTNFGTNGNYAQDTANERDQYVGTWQYSQNGILFQVKIEKVNQLLSKWEDENGTVFRYTYCDVVIFKYKLVVNGNLIQDNLNQTNLPDLYPSEAIKKGTDDDLYGSFFDITNNVASRVSIKLLNTATPKITFNLSPGAYYFPNPDLPNNPEPLFTVPTGEIEMVKIN